MAEKKKEQPTDYLAVIRNDIKTKEFKNIYVLYGKEVFLINNYKQALIKNILGVDDLTELDGNLNYNYYGDAQYELSSVRETANNMPFFAERRLIVIEDVDVFGPQGKGLDKILKTETLDSTYYIIVLRFYDETVKDSKLIDTSNAVYKVCAEKGVVALFPYQSEDSVKRWIASTADKAGKKVTNGAGEELIRRVGVSMQMLSTELEKLISYKADDDTITLDDVKEISQIKLSDKVFDMIGAMASKNQNRALALYGDLVGLQVKPAKILKLLVDHYTVMLTVKQLYDKGEMTRADIASRVKKPPFAVDKYISQGAKYTIKEIMQILDDIAQTTIDQRTGLMKEQLSLELIIVKYSTVNSGYGTWR